MRSIRFDQLGHTDAAHPVPRRPLSREMAAVKPPETLPEASSTSLPAASGVPNQPRPATDPPRS